MTSALVTLAIQETPAIIAGLQALFHRQNPDQPVPTSDEVLAAYQNAFTSAKAKDALWLSQHPGV